MPSDLPFWTVVIQVIRHTPPYVWAILLALVALGALQWRDHTVSRTRLALAPIGLGAFSLWGVTMAFGAHPTVLAAWLAGGMVALGAHPDRMGALRRIRSARAANNPERTP